MVSGPYKQVARGYDLRYVNLNIQNYAQTLVECLPLFAYVIVPVKRDLNAAICIGRCKPMYEI